MGLVLVAVSVLGMCWGQYAENPPEWIDSPEDYALEHYPEQYEQYIWYYISSPEYAKGRAAAKRLAENEFVLEFLRRLNASYDFAMGGAGGIAGADDAESLQNIDNGKVLVDYYTAAFENAKFSAYKFLKYYYEQKTGADGKTYYMCYVYGKVPVKAIDNMLLTINQNAEKYFEKQTGESPSDELKKSMEELSKKMLEDLKSEE